MLGIIAGCPYLTHVDVSGCRGVSNSAIQMMICKLSTVLTFLAVADAGRELSSSSIKDLTEKCISLKCLDVSYNLALTELVRTFFCSTVRLYLWLQMHSFLIGGISIKLSWESNPFEGKLLLCHCSQCSTISAMLSTYGEHRYGWVQYERRGAWNSSINL